uniref:Uncharacterized protein n=1 Tax=Kwoniella dejecticola CBS 10117 TaxID=1296121 RepID=A0A1A6A9P6_9TREE|nr:uncharacterized protein I303_02791 [Kwoniella dejecticola CBS 10117]OBR86776.1 hypothetical protein I303_02791 [Kwoniella dejecticola CBS 10117]
MYWYISFLRPPPVSVPSTSKEIIITPQVANDLRTELRYEPTSICYTWQRTSPPSSCTTPPQELTTFIPPQSTYKPIAIPLPPNVQIGESWRLGLFSPSTPSSASTSTSSKGKGKRRADVTGPSSGLLQLCEDSVDVLGVWSEGIQIVRPEGPSSGVIKGVNGRSHGTGTKGKGVDNGNDQSGVKGKGKGKGKEKEKDDGPKQGRITRQFILPSSLNGEEKADEAGEEEGPWRMLRIIEQTSFDLDKKIWDSGLALSAWFWKYLAPTSDASHTHPHEIAREVLDILRHTGEGDLDVLEIGIGTGLVSIALALALQRQHTRRRRIVATDLDTAIPLMDENLSYNSLNPGPTSQLDNSSTANGGDESGNDVQVEAKVLDWDQPLPEWVSSSWPQLVVAADVTYNTSAFPSLLRTLTSLLSPRPPPSTRAEQNVKLQENMDLDRPSTTPKSPLLILAYKQRDPAERELWGMLSSNGIEMTMIDKIQGATDEGETELWVGQMKVA